jgi:hypothetical protein
MICQFSLRRALTAGFCVCVLNAFAWGQDSGADVSSDNSASRDSSSSNSSLGDVARQTRAQHSADENKSSKAQQLADEMEQEHDEQENPPTGFKTYDAGDYHLFVPFPYILEGRDNGGRVLLGSRLGITNTEVMAGTPVPISANLSSVDVGNLARQVAQRYATTAYCSDDKLGTHQAYHCSLYGARLLGREVVGDLEIVVASNSLIPVMCVSPDEIRQCVTYDQWGYHTCDKRHPTWAEVQKANTAIDLRFRDERTTYQVCSQIIYPSIHLKGEPAVHAASIAEGKPARPEHAGLQNASMTTLDILTPGAQEQSLAELVRQTRQTVHDPAHATLVNSEDGSMAPPGFQAIKLQICQNPQQCSEAAIVIPEKAGIVSNVNGQSIFKTILNGDPVLLYAGPADVNDPYRSMTDRDYVRIRDLANPNGFTREKADAVSTQELTIAGYPALMTRFRYQRDGETWWIGERALIELHAPYGARVSQFMVACTTPEQRFAEAEALCTTLVNSLRLP